MRQQRLRRDARGVSSRFARQAPIVADDVVNRDPRGGEHRGYLIARRVQREPEHVEAAGDVRDGGRRKGCHGIHAHILATKPRKHENAKAYPTRKRLAALQLATTEDTGDAEAMYFFFRFAASCPPCPLWWRGCGGNLPTSSKDFSCYVLSWVSLVAVQRGIFRYSPVLAQVSG